VTDRSPVGRPVLPVDAPDEFVDLFLERLVTIDARPGRDRDEDKGDGTPILGFLLEECVEGLKPEGDPFRVVQAVEREDYFAFPVHLPYPGDLLLDGGAACSVGKPL